MKILILDYLFPKNHVALYSKIIEYLDSVANVKVVSNNQYYTGYDWKEVEVHEISVRTDRRSMIARKFYSLITMLKSRRIIAKNRKHYKLVMTFDTVAFALGRFFINTNNTFILHHKNIDELDNKIKKFFFKTYMNKVNHLVFEDFFKEYLTREIGVNKKRVFVIPHPVFISNFKNNEDIYDCIGLSNSNDESFIKKIIDEERKNGYLKKFNLNVILRSKQYNFDNGNLKIISGYLPKKDYDYYIKNSKSVFIPLPNNFRYRVSGVIFDAISNNKLVIANNAPIVKHYQKEYPDLCVAINNVEEFFEKLTEVKYNKKVKVQDFNKFIKHHDKKIILKKFNKAFLGLNNES